MLLCICLAEKINIYPQFYPQLWISPLWIGGVRGCFIGENEQNGQKKRFFRYKDKKKKGCYPMQKIESRLSYQNQGELSTVFHGYPQK